MKGNKKALVYLGAVIFIFAIFIYLLLKPSTQSKAIRDIETCANTEDVKAVWYKYRSDLADDEDFGQAVRNKLTSFQLKKSEIQEIKKWLPPKTTNLNVILVPDLSLRIKDAKNNPDQVSDDTAILKTVWNNFENKVRLKMNSKDRLLVDVADPGQGQGHFSKVADNLFFDLSDFNNKSNRLYFNQVGNKFSDNLQQIYNIASQRTTGADYVYYFSEKLPARLRKSTLNDDYRNIIIILTDGYLEVSLPGGGSKSVSPDPAALRQYCASGNASTFKFPVQTMDLDLSDVEVYLFEVNERQAGKGCDFKGLKRWWTEWFKNMHVKNADEDFIFQRQDAVNLSRQQIQTIFDAK